MSLLDGIKNALQAAVEKKKQAAAIPATGAQAASQSSVVPNTSPPAPANPIAAMITAALQSSIDPILNNAQTRIHAEAVGIEKEGEGVLSVALYTLLGAGLGTALLPVQFPLGAVLGAGVAFMFTKNQASYL